jgi:hypothetical protein
MDRAGHLGRDAVLELEYVGGGAFVSFRPELGSRLGVDQLHGDAHATAAAPHRRAFAQYLQPHRD